MNYRVPVFKGATRLPTFAGVPRMVLMGTFIVCGILFMFIHMYALMLFGMAYMVEWAITKHDDKMFNVLGLVARTKLVIWLDTLGTPFRKVWGGLSLSPTSYPKKNIETYLPNILLRKRIKAECEAGEKALNDLEKENIIGGHK